ncbi:MAG: hypothetical protein U9R40_02610 [Synergistota bacterium]|nr:hypothetical protein [Synergistota bacterium]
MKIDYSRVAVHEAGHVVMALMLGLNVQGCRIGSGGYQREAGRCTVIDPDPVGIVRFLVSMGGVMAEDRIFGDDRGGGLDRVQAAAYLHNWSAHFRRFRSDDALRDLLSDISELFDSDECRSILLYASRRIHADRQLTKRELLETARRIHRWRDCSDISARVVVLGAAEPASGLRGAVRDLMRFLKRLVEKIREI